MEALALYLFGLAKVLMAAVAVLGSALLVIVVAGMTLLVMGIFLAAILGSLFLRGPVRTPEPHPIER